MEMVERDAVVNLLYYFADEMCTAIVGDVEKLPSVDGEPIVHGKWLEYDKSYVEPPEVQKCLCSHCGHASARPVGRYCKWCGAKMDKEGESEK